jgi:hypothetical protein
MSFEGNHAFSGSPVLSYEVNICSEIYDEEVALLCGVKKRGEHALREHVMPSVNMKRNSIYLAKSKETI